MARRGVCLAAGNRVLTAHGYRNIEDIRALDRVLTRQGVFRDIINVFRITRDTAMYTIFARGHLSPIVCTPHQVFYTRKRLCAKPRWVAADQLRRQMLLSVPVSTHETPAVFTFPGADIVDNYDMALDDPDYWYLFGYFAGAGTLVGDGIITLAVRTADADATARLRRVIPLDDGVVDILQNYSSMSCESFTWHAVLSQFGADAGTRTLPEWVQDAPKKCLWAFLHGYTCSPAAYHVATRVHGVSASGDFAGGLQRVCLKLGLMALVTAPDNTALWCIEIILAGRADCVGFTDCVGFAWLPIDRIAVHAKLDARLHALEVSGDGSYCVGNVATTNVAER